MQKDEPMNENGAVVPSTALFNLFITLREQMKNAAMIAITVKPDCGPFYGSDEINAIRKVVPNDCLICFLRPEDSIAVMSEERMREFGWVRLNPGGLGTAARKAP